MVQKYITKRKPLPLKSCSLSRFVTRGDRKVDARKGCNCQQRYGDFRSKVIYQDIVLAHQLLQACLGLYVGLYVGVSEGILLETACMISQPITQDLRAAQCRNGALLLPLLCLKKTTVLKKKNKTPPREMQCRIPLSSQKNKKCSVLRGMKNKK